MIKNLLSLYLTSTPYMLFYVHMYFRVVKFTLIVRKYLLYISNFKCTKIALSDDTNFSISLKKSKCQTWTHMVIKFRKNKLVLKLQSDIWLNRLHLCVRYVGNVRQIKLFLEYEFCQLNVIWHYTWKYRFLISGDRSSLT